MGRQRVAGGVLLSCLICLGCVERQEAITGVPVPHELTKTVLPEYVIEPPDILLLDAISVMPKPPYHIQTGDILIIQVPNAFPTDPISGLYPVDPDGTVNIGLAYGRVRVTGLTIEDARAAIEEFLKPRIKDVKAIVALGQSRALQQIRGAHLVSPDGKIRLGVYGAVEVVGMTVPQAKAALEAHLTQYLDHPELSVNIIGYNSKVYYIIMDGAGFGQQIIRLPVTGNDTVLDALGQLGGLSAAASKYRMWVARPSPESNGCDQILPVDWIGISTQGRVATNYQLLPGDRLYIHGNPLIALETNLQRLIAPVERILGVTLLGVGTVSSIQQLGRFNTGGVGGVR
jgi:protein involved in polysaccharide export with SLBB domain